MMPFIQVTSDATEAPSLHTTIWAGADDDEEDDPVEELVGVDELLELQPAIASAAAAPTATSAAGVFLSPTDGTPSG
jgi:hypothetical protein